jgi:hypothetical protein
MASARAWTIHAGPRPPSPARPSARTSPTPAQRHHPPAPRLASTITPCRPRNTAASGSRRCSVGGGGSWRAWRGTLPASGGRRRSPSSPANGCIAPPPLTGFGGFSGVAGLNPGPRGRFRLSAPQRDLVGQPVEGGQKLADLLVGVGRGQLDAEPDLLAGHARVEGEGDVDPPLQQEAPGPGQVAGVGQGTSTIGKPERFRVNAPSFSRWSSTRRVLAQRTARSSSPLVSETWSPTSTLAREATGEGPEYR